MSLQTTYPVIKGLCRTCLAKEIELLSVFDYKTSNTRLDSVIASITGIKIKQEDGLPTTICKDCKEKATKAYDFKIHAQKSQNKLAKILKKGSDDILRDEEFTIDVDQKDVKVEQFIPDNQDELDFDISLPFDGTEDSYETDNVIKTEVKCEMDSSKENVKVNVVFDDESEKNSSYCPVCNQNFPDVDTLTDHAWTVHADLMGPRKRGRKKKLTSTFLHKLTENGLNLKQDKNPKQKCIFCISTFRTKDDLVSHVPEHKDEKIFSCMLCKMLYLTKKDFERHKCLEQHNNLEVLSDPELEDKRKEIRKHELYTEMRLQELFKKNIAEHRQPGLVTVCNSCGGLFGSEDQFNRHRDREHPELSVRCQLCDKVFATLKSASRHRSACERVERLFACSSCEMRFTHEVTLNKHILRVHTGQSVSLQFLDREHGPQNYKCETCSRTFASKALLERHTRSHKTGEKVFECDTCKKKFTRRENLRQHMRIHEGKTYTEGSGSLCLYCGRSFANSSNYIVHMRRHTGEKPYKCDFCGKGFCRSSDLQCHRRSHTGEKPCVCRECGKAFSRSNKLTRHMRVHTGVKPYKCTYCEKAFAQSNDLTLHVRRHTGDKPYVCELCGDRFIQGTALHAHRRSHGHYPPPAPPQQPPLTYTI